ncbi:MAG: response regulator [candidate division Zixibacteria bacterium]|nr:response regulator [candidate division Zixibacteria bacterium]MDD5425250.1 response regulator [candidate division Zixibacteria bacterium]
MPLRGVEKLLGKIKQRGEPFRILIVDDEKWVREVFRDFCDLTDVFSVDLAQSGEEALAKVRENQYDLITMDLIMPEMSGLEALNAIKKVSPKVPIMVITGNATDKLINEAGLLGACRVMYKPVLLEDFIAEMAETLLR